MINKLFTDHDLFQCPKVVFFGYLQVVGAGGQAWLLKTFNALNIFWYPASVIRPTMVALMCRRCVRHSFVCRVYYGPTMVGPEKSLKMNVLKTLENAILRLAFVNTVNTSFNYTFFELL